MTAQALSTVSSRPRISFLLVAALAVPLWAMARDPEPDITRTKAEGELQALRNRLRDATTSATQASLRRDLLAFELAYPGPMAPRAAALLSQLPSPLDALNPASIPALERFDWQPKELVAILGEHRGRQGTTVASVLFHPDGSMIASGGGNLVRLWDPTTMRLIGLAGFGDGVTSMAFNKDGTILGVGGGNGWISFYDIVKNRPPQHRFLVRACSSPVYSVAFHPAGKVLAAACHDNVIRFYDPTGTKLRELVSVPGHTAAVTAVAYSPDGKTLASGSQDETIRLWSVNGEDVREHTVLEAGSKGPPAMTFSPGGGNLAAAGSDGVIRIWQIPAPPKAPPKLVLPVKAGTISGLSYSSTGNTLALACSDNTVRLWAVAGAGAPRERGKLEGHAGSVTSVMYSPDKENRRLVSGSADWTVRTWDLTAAKPKERFVPWSHLSYIYSVAYAPDGQSLVSGSYDTIVRVWDLARAEPRTRSFLKGDPYPVYSVAYSPDGKLVAGGGAGAKVRQWDAITGRDKAHLSPVPAPVYRVAYSPDATRLLTHSPNDAILWDAPHGRQLIRLGLGDIRVNGVTWAPDGKQVVTYHGNYKYMDGKIVRKKDGTPEYIDCILRLYDAAEGKELSATKEQEFPISCAAFSADGKVVFSGMSYEPQLRRWDAGPTALVPIEPWKDLAAYPTEIIPAPDGQTLILRLGSGILAQHEVTSGKRLRQWSFQESIAGCGYSSDSRYLAVGLPTGVIYILQLTPPGAAK
jgi:WD40 repeat protein